MRQAFINELIPKVEPQCDEEEIDSGLSGNKEEYVLGVGDWVVNEPELAKEQNKIFDRFHDRLLEIIKPPVVKNDNPIWPLRLGMIGKELKHVQAGLIVVLYSLQSVHFTPKISIQPGCEKLTEALATRHPLVALNPASLVREAVEASQNEETVVHTLTPEETHGSFEIVDSSQLATPSNTSRCS